MKSDPPTENGSERPGDLDSRTESLEVKYWRLRLLVLSGLVLNLVCAVLVCLLWVRQPEPSLELTDTPSVSFTPREPSESEKPEWEGYVVVYEDDGSTVRIHEASVECGWRGPWGVNQYPHFDVWETRGTGSPTRVRYTAERYGRWRSYPDPILTHYAPSSVEARVYRWLMANKQSKKPTPQPARNFDFRESDFDFVGGQTHGIDK